MPTTQPSPGAGAAPQGHHAGRSGRASSTSVVRTESRNGGDRVGDISLPPPARGCFADARAVDLRCVGLCRQGSRRRTSPARLDVSSFRLDTAPQHLVRPTGDGACGRARERDRDRLRACRNPATEGRGGDHRAGGPGLRSVELGLRRFIDAVPLDVRHESSRSAPHEHMPWAPSCSAGLAPRMHIEP